MSKRNSYDYNSLVPKCFRANPDRFRSNPNDDARRLRIFVERRAGRINIAAGRRPVRRNRWPRSRFRLAPDLVLEQQMFWTHDCSDVAISWELRGEPIPAQLIVRPYFCGCGPRWYRDIGFRLEPQEHGGRLAWLPSVRGPRIIADTNGRYYDEPARFAQGKTIAFSSDNLVAPGTFDFQLSNRPSVLIISTDAAAKTQRSQNVGVFLAGLMPKSDFTPVERELYPSASLVEAA